MDSVVRDAHILLLRTATNQPKQGQINQRRLVAEEKSGWSIAKVVRSSRPTESSKPAVQPTYSTRTVAYVACTCHGKCSVPQAPPYS